MHVSAGAVSAYFKIFVAHVSAGAVSAYFRFVLRMCLRVLYLLISGFLVRMCLQVLYFLISGFVLRMCLWVLYLLISGLFLHMSASAVSVYFMICVAHICGFCSYNFLFQIGRCHSVYAPPCNPPPFSVYCPGVGEGKG